MFDSIKLGNAHHAYAMEGDPTKIREELWKLFESEWHIETKGNPDFSYQKSEIFSIDDARRLKESQENKAFGGGKKFFVIETDTITAEAQNSLLKMFEEPTEQTHFFLLGNCVKSLIPTLESRVLRIKADEAAPMAIGAAALEFLAAPLSKRLALVKKLADDIKDEKKTRADALDFLHEIELTLYQKTKQEGKLPDKMFKQLEICRDYLNDRSASVKMILEYVAFIIPHIS